MKNGLDGEPPILCLSRRGLDLTGAIVFVRVCDWCCWVVMDIGASDSDLLGPERYHAEEGINPAERSCKMASSNHTVVYGLQKLECEGDMHRYAPMVYQQNGT
jgi:hypothetical protein